MLGRESPERRVTLGGGRSLSAPAVPVLVPIGTRSTYVTPI